MVLRILCGAWLVPAASLIWIGLATAGVRSISPASLAIALGRTQATAVVLMVFTVLVGASAFIRTPPPVGIRTPPPVGTRTPPPERLWLVGHIAAVAIALPMVPVGLVVESLAPMAWPLAALGGFAGGLALPRALIRVPGTWSGPLAALAVGMVFQLTVGWLHVVHPTATASPILLAEGLILAWVATSAARVDPFDSPVAPAAVSATTGLEVGAAPRPGQEAALPRVGA